MRLLLDTHIFLWLISNDTRLSANIREMVANPDNAVFLSVASVWEAVIKYALGKLPLPEAAATYLPRQRERHQIASLLIDEASAARLASLPPLHRDPFDRILLCQALTNNLTLVTEDTAVRAYPANFLPTS